MKTKIISIYKNDRFGFIFTVIMIVFVAVFFLDLYFAPTKAIFELVLAIDIVAWFIAVMGTFFWWSASGHKK